MYGWWVSLLGWRKECQMCQSLKWGWTLSRTEKYVQTLQLHLSRDRILDCMNKICHDLSCICRSRSRFCVNSKTLLFKVNSVISCKDLDCYIISRCIQFGLHNRNLLWSKAHKHGRQRYWTHQLLFTTIEMASSCNSSITAFRDPPPYHLNVKLPSSHPAWTEPSMKAPQMGQHKVYVAAIWEESRLLWWMHKKATRCPSKVPQSCALLQPPLTTMSQCEMIHLRWQTAVYPWRGRNPCSKYHTLCYMFMQLDCFIGPIKWSCDNWA